MTANRTPENDAVPTGNPLPAGWEWKKLGNVTTKTGTKNPKKEPNKFFEYLDISSIDKDNQKIVETKLIIGKEAPSRARKIGGKYDIVFATTRPNLKNIAIIENDYENLICSTGFCVLRPREILDYKFLFYFLITDYIQDQISPFIRGAQYPAISDTDLYNCKIPLPPLPEQQRIVRKLDAAFARLDDAIQLQRDNLERIEDMRKSVLAEVFEGGDWEVKSIREIAFVKGGKRLPKGEKLLDEKTKFPYIRVADFNEFGTIDLEKVKYINEKVQKSIKNYIISSKDLYISIAGTIGRTGIIPSELEGANLTENAAKLVYKQPSKISNRFVYFFTLSKFFIEQVEDATKTVAQPKLALSRLSEIQIPLPPLPEQARIVEHLDAAFAQLDQLHAVQSARLAHLEALKGSVLREAFEGKL